MRQSFVFLTVIFLMTLSLSVHAQIKEKQDSVKKDIFHLGGDLFSRYLWRGTCWSKVPNVQPTVYYEAPFGLKVGAWGSYAFDGNYAEADLFLSYTIKGVSLTFTDYFVMNEGLAFNKYFNYNGETTGHQFEAMLGYAGPEKLPVYLQAATIFYGADKKLDKTVIDTVAMDTTNTYVNQFSTYLEAGYTIRNCTLFVGFTPMSGIYGNTLGVVNLGLTARKEIRITDKFSLPVQASVITNPQRGNIHFVFGVTL